MKKNFITNQVVKENLKLLICISFPLNLVIYPILNLYHFLLALIFVMILFFYILDYLVFTPILGKTLYNKLSVIISIIIITLDLLYSLLSIFNVIEVPIYCKDKNHPYYIF